MNSSKPHQSSILTSSFLSNKFLKTHQQTDEQGGRFQQVRHGEGLTWARVIWVRFTCPSHISSLPSLHYSVVFSDTYFAVSDKSPTRVGMYPCRTHVRHEYVGKIGMSVLHMVRQYMKNQKTSRPSDSILKRKTSFLLILILECRDPSL